MNNIIRNIAIHHSGGIGQDNYASSYHLTFGAINKAHKTRWNFPSQHIPDSYGGYNFIYDPKIRRFHQYRAVGEETAAQRGSNLDTISICIIGNYLTRKFPSPVAPVDELSRLTIEHVENFIIELITGRAFTHSGWVVVPGAELKLSPTRIYPHYFFQSDTECYGDFMTPDFFRKRVSDEIYFNLQKQIMEIYAKIKDVLEKRKFNKLALGSSDRCCEGNIII